MMPDDRAKNSSRVRRVAARSAARTRGASFAVRSAVLIERDAGSTEARVDPHPSPSTWS
jgi:hypothetical protein